MRIRRTIVIAGAMLLSASLGSSAQSGGGYGVRLSVIGAGGGQSANAGYVLTGTIGQHEAATQLGGAGYALQPGFWGGASSAAGGQTPPGADTLFKDGFE